MTFAKWWKLPSRKRRGRPAEVRPGLECLESRQLLSVFTWVSGASGSWDTAQNWTNEHGDHGVPGPLDTAVIGDTAASVSHANDRVGVLQFSAGTLTGSGELLVGDLNWTGGTMRGPGNPTTRVTGTATLNGAGALILDGSTFLNEGVTQWQGTGQIQLNSGAALVNAGTFLVNTSGDVMVRSATGTGSITNGGLFEQTSGGTTRIDNAVSFITNGGVDVEAGVLVLAGSSVMTGGGVAGGGTLRVTGTFDWVTGTMDDPGLTEVVTESGRPAATLIIDTLADHFLLGGRTFNNGALVTWTAASTIYVGDQVHMNNLPGATFDAQDDGTLTLFNVGTWYFRNEGLLRKSATGTPPGRTLFDAGSVFTDVGTVEVDAGTLNLAGAFTNFDAGSMTLTGGTYHVFATFQFNDAAIVTNAATVIMDGPAAQIVDQNGTDALGNYFAVNDVTGFFTLRNGAALTTPGDFLNAGQVFIESQGNFTANVNYTQTGGATTLTDGLLNAALVDVQAGLLVGWGTITADVQNAGELDVGGNADTHELNVAGNYTQLASGVARFKLNGENPQTPLYDRLNVSGQVALDGTLKVIFLSEQAPRSDFFFDVLHYGSRLAGSQFRTLQAPDAFAILFLQYHDDQGKMDFLIDFA